MMNETIRTLTSRRSCRAFRAEQLPQDTLDEILYAGLCAPSARGRRPWHIVVLQKREEIAALEALNAKILGNPDAHPFYGAPTVCLVLVRADIATGVEDGALVMGNLMNAAASLGVGSCWIHRAYEEFELPEGKALLQKWGIEGDWRGVGHCLLGAPAQTPAERAPLDASYVTRV